MCDKVSISATALLSQLGLKGNMKHYAIVAAIITAGTFFAMLPAGTIIKK